KGGWRAMILGHQNIVATIAACGPNRGDARSFRTGGAIFHFTVCPDAYYRVDALPARFRNSVETKTPPGEHRGGVIAAQTRKGGSAFSRANCNNPGTKGTGGRFDSRLWNREFCSGRASPCDRKTGTRSSPAVNRRPARPQRRRRH